MTLLERAKEHAKVLVDEDALMEEERNERRALFEEQRRRRFRLRLRSESYQVEEFSPHTYVLVEDLVLVEFPENPHRGEDMLRWSMHVIGVDPTGSTQHLSRVERERFSQSGTALLVPFPLKQADDLAVLVATYPKVNFEADAVLALLANGTRLQSPVR